MLNQNLNGLTGERNVKRVVNVRGETEHDLFVDASGLILPRISAKVVQKVWTGSRACIKILPCHPEHQRDIAVAALVAASTVGIRGQRGILSGLSSGGIDIGAALDGGAFIIRNSLTFIFEK
jgi:hypothetical protein